MKNLAILVIVVGLLTFENHSMAQIKMLKKSERVMNMVQVKKRSNNNDEILRKIFENNQKVTALLEQRSSVPVIWENHSKILTGKVFRGALLNSINSTNIDSPVLVQAYPNQGLPYKTMFACQATTQNKRVYTLCNKMVTTEKEIPIVAQILNIDGTSGLLGEYNDGKEDLIIGAVASDFSQGVLSAAQSRIVTPLGGVTDSSIKNQVLQGFIESGKTTSDILLEEMKTMQPVVAVSAGEEVLIYFMEAVNEM
jgi:hypothetical protein